MWNGKEWEGTRCGTKACWKVASISFTEANPRSRVNKTAVIQLYFSSLCVNFHSSATRGPWITSVKMAQCKTMSECAGPALGEMALWANDNLEPLPPSKKNSFARLTMCMSSYPTKYEAITLGVTKATGNLTQLQLHFHSTATEQDMCVTHALGCPL
jgi:hypothetical protein